jgi:hypothetical protein
MYFGKKPARLSAEHPPRGSPGEGPLFVPFDIEFIDSERMLPVLVSNYNSHCGLQASEAEARPPRTRTARRILFRNRIW